MTKRDQKKDAGAADAADYARISLCGEVTYFSATPDPGRNKQPSARLRLKVEEVSDDHTRTLYVGCKCFGDVVDRIVKEVIGRGAVIEVMGAMASEQAMDPEADYKEPLKDVNGKVVYETVLVIDDGILEQHEDALIVHEAGEEEQDDRGGNRGGSRGRGDEDGGRGRSGSGGRGRSGSGGAGGGSGRGRGRGRS